MRAAGKAWISVVVLVAGIALLPGLLYLLGLVLAGGRPKPADRALSGVAACSSEPRAGYRPMNPWRFTAQFFDNDAMKKVPEVSGRPSGLPGAICGGNRSAACCAGSSAVPH